MSNVKELEKAAKKKYLAELKKIHEDAARKEEQLLARVARLMEQHEPERFAQYRERAASLIEQEEKEQKEQRRAARAARAKAARARRKAQSEAVRDDGGEAQ